MHGAQVLGQGLLQQAWDPVALLYAGAWPLPTVCPRGALFAWMLGGQSSHSVPVPHLPYHVAKCAQPCSALQPGAEPEASPLTVAALLELGAVTSIPQSHNYHHLAWVSDLEQGAAQPGRPPAASRPTTGDSFVVHNNNHDDNSCHLLDTRCGPGSGLGALHAERDPLLLLPSFPPASSTSPGLDHNR